MNCSQPIDRVEQNQYVRQSKSLIKQLSNFKIFNLFAGVISMICTLIDSVTHDRACRIHALDLHLACEGLDVLFDGNSPNSVTKSISKKSS